MDIDDYLNFEFDLSEIESFELTEMGVTLEELTYVFRNPNTEAYHVHGRPLNEYRYYHIGFSQAARCFELYFKYTDKICFTLIQLADERTIQEFWCEGKRRSYFP